MVRQQGLEPWTLLLAPSVLLNVSVLLASIYEMRLIFIYFFKHFAIQNCLILTGCLQAKLWQISFVLLAWVTLARRSGWGDLTYPCSTEGAQGCSTVDMHCPPTQPQHLVQSSPEAAVSQERGLLNRLGAKSALCPPHCCLHSGGRGWAVGTLPTCSAEERAPPRPRGWRGWKVRHAAS